MDITVAPLSIPYFRQPEWYFCGPSCLKMGMAHFGVLKSEYELAHVANTNEAVGTTHEGMVQAAKESGFHVAESSEGSLLLLTTLLNLGLPIVTYIRAFNPIDHGYGILDEMHYVVVVGIDRGEIIYHDPDDVDGSAFDTLPIDVFLSRWHCEWDFDKKWLMVLSPEPVAL